MPDGLAERVFGIRLEAAQHLGGHLLRCEDETVEVDARFSPGWSGCSTTGNWNRRSASIRSTSGREPSTDEPLDRMRDDGGAGRRDRVHFMADGECAPLMEDERRRPVAVIVPRRNDLGLTS